MNVKNTWWIYKGTGEPHDGIQDLPDPPNWRKFDSKVGDNLYEPAFKHAPASYFDQQLGLETRGATFQTSDEEKDLVNAALYLRRPLFVTGKPGCGKSSLAYAVAHELKLGPVLHWSITTRTTLQDSLYHYDAIGRLQEASLIKEAAKIPDIGQYLRLGPLGTALLPTKRPRVLLIDEIDKSDIDLPNDLLNIFEEGEYSIPELSRLSRTMNKVAVMPYDGTDDDERVLIQGGYVRCYAFPFIVLTSNGERDFPPAFLRRCLRLTMQPPDKDKLRHIVEAHLGSQVFPQAEDLITNFVARRSKGDLATDQLLNAIYLVTNDKVKMSSKEKLFDALWKYLSRVEDI